MSANPPTAGLRILCVEDDAEIRAALADILADEGYDVVVAADAEGGLERLQKGRFHLLISDYKMPGHDGDWLMRQAAAQGFLDGCAAILFTSHSAPEHPDGVTLLRKPLPLDVLLRHVNDALAPARAAILAQARDQLDQSRQSAVSPPVGVRIDLVLYISAASPASLRAVRNLQALLREFEESQVRLKVQDLSQESSPSAAEDHIAFTPTLVRHRPGPRTWILGDLADGSMVAELLHQAGVERKA